MTAATTTAEGERLRRVSPLRLFFSRPESGAIAGAVIVFLIFGVLSALRGDIGKGFLSIQGAASYLEVTAQNQGAIRLYQNIGFSKARTVYKAVEVAYS